MRAAVGIPGLSQRALPRVVTHGRTSTNGRRQMTRAAAAAASSPSWNKIPTTHHARRRHFTTSSSYFRTIVDRLTGGGTRRTNPFLENHRILFPKFRDDPGETAGKQEEEKGGSSSVQEAVVRTLDFSFVASMDRIRHWKEADRTIREARAEEMRQLLRFVEEKKNGDNESRPPPTTTLWLPTILQRWNRAEAPASAHQSVAAWMHLLYHLDGANATEGDDEDGPENDKEVLALVDELLMTIVHDYDLDSESGEDGEDIRRTLAYLVRQQRDRTGFGLPHEEARGQYRDVLMQLRELEKNLGEMLESYHRQHGGSAVTNSSSFWSPSSSTASSTPPDLKRMVSSMYGYLHLKRQQAQLLGYDSLVSQTFDRGLGGGGGGFAVASLEQVRDLHDGIFQRLSPRLQQMAQRHEIVSASTSGYLSPSGHPGGEPGLRRPPSSSDGPGRPVRPMVWQRHVTLDGALRFANRLALDLFGLQIAEDASVVKDRVWDPSVRLFHVHDAKTSTFLGSFYLDPLARPSKVPRSFATVLYPSATSSSVAGGSASASIEASSRSPLVVGMSLNIEPPSWDTDPVRLRWDDILSLLHELGHVLDIFGLLNSRKERLSFEAIAGHASLPFHRSEVLPKFMEHWMTDLPSMHALLDFSETTSPFSDEEIEASVRDYSRMKFQELAQLVFYGELELRLFSSELDLQQDSILALQRELAHKYIPHDVPDSQSNVLTPLVDVIQETMSGRPVSWSRYVLGDVVSANLFRNLQRQHRQGGRSSSPKDDGREALLRTLYDDTQLRSGDLLDPTGLWELYKFGYDID